jgi:hypothetical protein
MTEFYNENFEAYGFTCLIVQNRALPFMCAYVALPEGNPLCGKDYLELNKFIDVHGGLTFSEYYEDLKAWLIGFDTGHSGDVWPDLIPQYPKQIRNFFEPPFPKFWTVSLLKAAVIDLAKQIRDYTERGSLPE